uniref:Actin-related protein 8 n=1 Tax=Parasteatoda tepidariorum TaxID=114398 RepID=A0A2L2YMX4_PARTP
MAPILTKKPVNPIPVAVEPAVEPIQPSSVIVIHPGSMYLRIGRASESYPKVIPHVIARRNRLGPSPIHRDPTLVPLINLSQELKSQLHNYQVTLGSILASCMTSDGRLRNSIPLNIVTEYNSKVKPQVISGKSDIPWTKVDDQHDIFIGEDALRLQPGENFNIHWPIRRGQFNLHSGVGGSMTSVLSDLEAIWSTACQKLLDISPKDLKSFRAVLVISDVYKREHVREMVYLLLTRLGFMSCFVHLESVCATFGAGVSFACVVDVGDQKTAVSCVEDGISHKNTRLNINYGGNDITRLFHWFLGKLSFPYKCSPELPLDCLTVQELKEQLCHVNLDIYGVQDKYFTIKRPSVPVLRYGIKVGDECLIAPLALFHPELFGITGPKKVQTHTRNEGLPDDPYDEQYLIQTQRRGVKDVAEGHPDQSALDESHLNASLLEEDMDSADPPTNPNAKEMEDISCDQLFGVDQAILQSIERCDSEEVKRKLYSCILFVGGGMMFQGIHSWFHNKFRTLVPRMYRADPYDIITRPKDLDPRVTVWKGAALMSCLDTAQELWIKKKEWMKYNVKILREKAPFIW